MKKIASLSYLSVMTIGALSIALSSVGFSRFMLISLGFYTFLFFFFLGIFGRIKTALLTAGTFIIILQLLNQLKIHFYKERLFFPDIFMALDPNNIEVLLYYPTALLAVTGLTLLFILNACIFRNDNVIKFIFRIGSVCFSLLIVYAICLLSQHKPLVSTWESYLPKGRGTIVNLFLSAQDSAYSPPVFGVSSTYFRTQQAPENQNPKTKPDIVVLLQESAINPNLFSIPERALPKLDQFSAGDNVAINNLLRVETYGGGTWLSEFSLLTGLSSGDFSFRKNAVFYTIMPHVQTGLFHELKRNGYFTVVLTPMNDMNYNAGAAYRHLGADLILQPQKLGYPAPATENLWKIPTQEMINYTKKVLETYTDKPLLIYVLSMFEHGPYDEKHADTHHLSPYIANPAVRGRFNDYLNRVIPLNAATLDFDRYLQARNKPALFLYFGDHQPSLNWKAQFKTDLPSPDYLTQFSLRHYHLPLQMDSVGKITDIAFLGGLILEAIHADISPFYEANIKMRHLCEGKLSDCADKKLVDSYKHYIYQDVQSAGK